MKQPPFYTAFHCIISLNGQHIIYWEYRTGNIAYETKTFLYRKHMGQQLFFKACVRVKDFLTETDSVIILV